VGDDIDRPAGRGALPVPPASTPPEAWATPWEAPHYLDYIVPQAVNLRPPLDSSAMPAPPVPKERPLVPVDGDVPTRTVTRTPPEPEPQERRPSDAPTEGAPQWLVVKMMMASALASVTIAAYYLLTQDHAAVPAIATSSTPATTASTTAATATSKTVATVSPATNANTSASAPAVPRLPRVAPLPGSGAASALAGTVAATPTERKPARGRLFGVED
jgi:hypothetical protein